MKSLTYVELCAGLGGTRAGLEKAGWHCSLALDNDSQVAAAHRIAFGACEHDDITERNVQDIPPHDLLVAGFPCQPFSSSGTRTGFSHAKGNVFQSVAHVVAHHRPKALLLENVRGLLSNAYGHTFASVLRTLTALEYDVAWGVLDSAWFGVPQARPRVFIVGRSTCSAVSARGPAPNQLLGQYLHARGKPTHVELDSIIQDRRPRVGLRRPILQTPFGAFGSADNTGCWTWTETKPRIIVGHANLGDIVCPEFRRKDEVRSVRYWGHTGVTRPYFKAEPVAHCLGTNIGAGPTFGLEKSKIGSARDRSDLLQHANWVREELDHLIFRLQPSRAVLLFGSFVEPLQRALIAQSIGITKQYEMLGNLVTPEIARRIGEGLRSQLDVNSTQIAVARC